MSCVLRDLTLLALGDALYLCKQMHFHPSPGVNAPGWWEWLLYG